MLILFLHGWQSVPGGVKPTYLLQHGHEVLNPALPDDDFDQAVAIAQDLFDKHQPDVVVGSSRGGAVAMNINGGETPLVLLCPAWKKYGKAKSVRSNTTILHSKADEVIPFADSEELVRNSDLPPYVLMEVGNDHRLADPGSLQMMLDACNTFGGDDTEDDEPLTMDWENLCYGAVLRWAKDADEDDWVVIHGTVFSGRVGKRIDHAWCERGEVVVDLTLPIGHRIVKKETYYNACKPQIDRAYPAKVALRLAERTRIEGPWTEEEQLER